MAMHMKAYAIVYCLSITSRCSLCVVRCPTAVIHHRTKSKELPAGASESQIQSQLGSANGYSNTFQDSHSNWDLPMETFSSEILWCRLSNRNFRLCLLVTTVSQLTKHIQRTLTQQSLTLPRYLSPLHAISQRRSKQISSIRHVCLA